MTTPTPYLDPVAIAIRNFERQRELYRVSQMQQRARAAR